MWLERFRYDIVPEWKIIIPYADYATAVGDPFFEQLQNDWDMQVQTPVGNERTSDQGSSTAFLSEHCTPVLKFNLGCL